MLARSQKFQESSLESRVTVNLLLCITADGSITGRGVEVEVHSILAHNETK